jgi:hypothetical protein
MKFCLSAFVGYIKGEAEMPSGGARRVAERGGQPDKDQQEHDEGHGNERREEERRERENEGLRARLDRLSNALRTAARLRRIGQNMLSQPATPQGKTPARGARAGVSA